MRIRAITPDDSGRYLALCNKLDRETKMMMLEPGERSTDVEQEKRNIDSVLSAGNSMIFVVEEGDQLVGYLGAYGGTYRRNRHKAYIVIGVLQQYAGRGFGTALFTETEKWAKNAGLNRLELTVMAHNQRALALYKKVGFRIEGTARNSLVVDDAYVDEYYMAKLLP